MCQCVKNTEITEEVNEDSVRGDRKNFIIPLSIVIASTLIAASVIMFK